MPEKKFDDILRDLKNKIYSPIYLLHGEEGYYIDEISNTIESSILDEMEKEFNQSVIYGRETEPLSLLSIAKRYPMMANHSVVIVKEAQDMKYFSGKEKDDNDPLLAYLLKPLGSTLLVFCHKYQKLDQRSKLYKAFLKHGVVFESARLYDDKIPAWVSSYFQMRGYKIKPQATQLMAEYLGNDLSKIANECDKLMLNVPQAKEIDVLQVEQNIGISKDFNVFELNNALARKQALKVFRIADYFKANPKTNPLIVTLSTLYIFFSKIFLFHTLTDKSRQSAAAALGVHPFFMNDYESAAKNYSREKVISILSILREYDLKSKGIINSTGTEGDLLREMLYKILN